MEIRPVGDRFKPPVNGELEDKRVLAKKLLNITTDSLAHVFPWIRYGDVKFSDINEILRYRFRSPKWPHPYTVTQDYLNDLQRWQSLIQRFDWSKAQTRSLFLSSIKYVGTKLTVPESDLDVSYRLVGTIIASRIPYQDFTENIQEPLMNDGFMISGFEQGEAKYIGKFASAKFHKPFPEAVELLQ